MAPPWLRLCWRMGVILPKKHGVGDPTHLFNPYQIWYLCVKADYSIDVIQALAKLIIEEDWFPLYGLGPLSFFTGTPDPLVEMNQATLAWSFYKYVTCPLVGCSRTWSCGCTTNLYF